VLPFQTVLCPLDFSEPSYKALHNAAEIARHFNAELVIVHVIPPLHTIPADPAYVFEGPEGHQQHERSAAEDRLVIAAKQLPSELKSRHAIASGDAAEEIARLATAESADLIVIATHGLTGWRHMIFGSVAEKVIRLADRPVLVIPVHESD
jgi:universal stress protein A